MGGDCVNATGTFAHGNGALTAGGSSAASTGYIVYRCTTLNGCTISTTDQFAFANNAANFPNYLIFDGWVMTQTAPTVSFRSAVQAADSNTGLVAHSHHWWVINSIISGWGQSGIQLNDGEFFYSVHNTTFGNSNSCSAAQGSGISYVVLKPVSGYSKTADDLSNPKMSIYGTNNPFNNVVAWNVSYNNWVGCGTGNTDGNGIILDTFCTSNGNTIDYPNLTLVAFNVIYNNGGAGIRMFQSSGLTVVNNSTFNNHIDTSTGTERGEIDEGATGGCYNGSNANSVASNAVWTIRPSSGVTSNNNIYIGNFPQTVFSFNIGRWTGGGSSGSYGMSNGATWNNGLPATVGGASQSAGWVDVANTSNGSLTTQPNGVNFALGAGSVAIGRGVTQTYLSSQAVDEGACYNTLLTCP